MYTYIYVYMYMYIVSFSVYLYKENGNNEKWQLLFVCCKWKTETANFHLFA